MKSETLAQRAKKQIVKGFFYWIWRYISIFLASAAVCILIAFTITVPLYMIFDGYKTWFSLIIGGSMGSLTAMTTHNIPRYQNCWLSIKLNFYRYRTLRTIENWKVEMVQGYVNSQLKDLMEDYTK